MGKKKPKKKLYETDLNNDIRYRGPLSYRHFRILGWLCLALSQAVFLFTVFTKASGGTIVPIPIISLSSVASLSVPFLLLANFASILDNTDGYKDQLLLNGAVSGIIILASLFFYHHYILGIAATFLGGRAEAVNLVENAAYGAFSTHFLSFNLFLDLFLCSLFMLFLNYRPKKYFQGRKILIFRLCAAFPVLYEAASITLKGLAVTEHIRIPVSVYPFLTTKPPAMFLVFLVLAAFIKTRERRFCKNGRSHQEYMQYLKTNRNSLEFSIFTAIVLAAAAVLDFLLLIVPSVFFAGEQVLDPNEAQQLPVIWERLMAMGIGHSGMLLPMAPIVLLFSYTKTYRSRNLDFLIPIGGVVLIVLLYLEAAYRAICMLPQFFG